MRALALLLGIIGVSAAATIYAMDGRDLQEAMMKEMLAREGHNPVPPAMGAAMGFGTLMGQHGEEEGPGIEALGDEGEEGVADREARDAEAEGLGSVGREGKSPAEGNGQGASGFGTMMGMMFPEMMFGGGAYDAAPAPYAGNGYHGNNGHAQANGNGHPIPSNGNGHPLPSNGNANGYSRPANGNGNGHAKPANGNGNGHATPANGNGNGHAKPANGNGNGHSRPANGNGNRGGYGGAAAASANSFSRGSNSFASSQAQAFSGNFGNGNH